MPLLRSVGESGGSASCDLCGCLLGGADGHTEHELDAEHESDRAILILVGEKSD